MAKQYKAWAKKAKISRWPFSPLRNCLFAYSLARAGLKSNTVITYANVIKRLTRALPLRSSSAEFDADFRRLRKEIVNNADRLA